MRTLVAILFFFLSFCALQTYSQNYEVKRGDKEFYNFDFKKAIIYFQDAVRKDRNDVYSTRKIADCNRLINNYEQAEIWYANTLKLDTTNVQDFFFYAQALRGNGKYEQAEEVFYQYLERNPTDLAAIKIAGTFKALTNLEEDKGRFEIKHLNMNTTATEYSPAFYKEQVIFVSNRDASGIIEFNDNWSEDNFYQLFLAKVDDEGELVDIDLFKEFGINGRFHEGPVCFDQSTNELLFTRSNYVKRRPFLSEDEIVNLRIFTTNVGRGTVKNEIVEPFAFNSDEYSVCHPAVSKNGSMVIFVSTEKGGFGESDLYLVFRKDGRWSEPENLGEVINTNRREMFPFLADDNTLYFASEGHLGLGGLDIYRCDYVNGSWTRPVNLGTPINSEHDDFAFIINQGKHFGYFTSNRTSSYDDDDIFYFKQTIPDKCIIAGIAKDKETGDFLPGAEIALFSQNGELIEEGIADNSGAYSFAVEPGGSYILKGMKHQYLDGDNAVALDERCELIRDKGEEEITAYLAETGELLVDLILDKSPEFSLWGRVIDRNTGEPLQGVTVNVTDIVTGDVVLSELTGSDGTYKKILVGKRLNDMINYRIELDKESYLPHSYDFVKILTTPGVYRTSADLVQLELGMNLADVININPIYFDLDKYNIRPDAAAELDKIFHILERYPKMEIELSSHTDCRASNAYNIKLSDNRARSSKLYLVQRGISSDRIFGMGYGENLLTNGCKDGVKCSETQHQLNRRTEFIILKL